MGTGMAARLFRAGNPGNKKGRGENAPTFLIIALFTRASTSVFKGIGRCGHCERQKGSSAHQQGR
jgi:hypothetical protein